MAYFNYHATAKKLISQGKLVDYIVEPSAGFPVLFLYFDDIKHPVMKIKSDKIPAYMSIIAQYDKNDKKI